MGALTPARASALAPAPGLAALAAFAAWISFQTGRVGYMPLDQSIVFDGGWRILGGQVPLVDFYAPTSLVPSLIQAGFFAVLGVSWSAYLAHAALFNALFALLSYRLLRRVDLARVPALYFGALSAVVFYPPFGVPFADQHSFFFLLAALWLLAELPGRGRRARDGIAVLLPGILLAGLLSKPVPAAYGLAFVVLLPWLQLDAAARNRLWVVFSAAAVVWAAALAALGAAAGVQAQDARFWLFTLPSAIGGARTALYATSPATALARAFDVVSRGGLVSTLLVLLFVAGWLARMPARERTARRLRGLVTAAAAVTAVAFPALLLAGPERLHAALPLGKSVEAWTRYLADGRLFLLGTGAGAAGIALLGLLPATRELRLRASATTRVCLLMAGSLPLVSIAFAMTANNQAANGMALVPLAMGFAYAALPVGTRSTPPDRRWLVVAVVLAAVAGLDVFAFHQQVNLPRRVQDYVDRGDCAAPPGGRLPGLDALVWNCPPDGLPFTRSDLEDTVRYLRAQPHPFLLLGHATIVSGLSGKPSVSPFLWYDPGVSLPDPAQPGVRALVERRLRLDPETLFVTVGRGQGQRDLLGPGTFERCARLVERFGAFAVYENRCR